MMRERDLEVPRQLHCVSLYLTIFSPRHSLLLSFALYVVVCHSSFYLVCSYSVIHFVSVPIPVSVSVSVSVGVDVRSSQWSSTVPFGGSSLPLFLSPPLFVSFSLSRSLL